MSARLDVLIPTRNRPAALAVTLTSLAAQRDGGFRVVVSDQSDTGHPGRAPEVRAARRVIESHGQRVDMLAHLPRRGMAEQRHFLLDQAWAPYVLFLDDDVILEPFVIGQLMRAIREYRCGFVGSAVIGLSFLADERPDEQHVEFWSGAVLPEDVRPGTPAWQRYRLHNAANLYHVQRRLGLTPDTPRAYRVAWVGGCVLYDAASLRAAGGFDFWPQLPAEHCGEDVLAQLRVMARFGGCGIMPSGVYHQELPTTVEDRSVNAPQVLPLDPNVSSTGANDAHPRNQCGVPRLGGVPGQGRSRSGGR